MKAIVQYLRNLLSSLFGRSGRMISCAEFESFILDYLDENLSSDERAIFERHIAGCGACHDYLDAYRQTVALGRAVFAVPEAALPREVPAELVDAILKARVG